MRLMRKTSLNRGKGVVLKALRTAQILEGLGTRGRMASGTEKMYRIEPVYPQVQLELLQHLANDLGEPVWPDKGIFLPLSQHSLSLPTPFQVYLNVT